MIALSAAPVNQIELENKRNLKLRCIWWTQPPFLGKMDPSKGGNVMRVSIAAIPVLLLNIALWALFIYFIVLIIRDRKSVV